MGKLEAVIFDCFGVLYVDYSQAYFARFSEPRLLQELHELNSACDHGFINRDEYFTHLEKLTGNNRETIDKAFQAEHVINQPAVDYIKQELKPHVRTGLLSNIGRGWMQNFFDEHELHDLFDAVVMSYEEGIAKPEPAIFRRMAEKLDVPAENCLMIDDRRENCQGAETAGMQSIFYEDFAQVKSDLAQRLQKH